MSISVDSSQSVSDCNGVEELPPGWETAWVTYSTKRGLRKSIQIIDCRKVPWMQYTHDSMRIIACKCAGLVVGIPIFAVFNLFVHLVRTAVLVLGTVVRSTCFVLEERTLESLKKVFLDLTWEVSEILLRAARDVIKLPVFALTMQLCCVYGIFFPLEGRVLAGNAESVIKGVDRSHDLRFRADIGRALYQLFTDKDATVCFHWAFCFQPKGPINEKVTRIEYLRKV
jgi:hypothetical protein